MITYSSYAPVMPECFNRASIVQIPAKNPAERDAKNTRARMTHHFKILRKVSYLVCTGSEYHIHEEDK